MATFTIKKGMDIRLAGAPEAVIADAPATNQFVIYPSDYPGIKPRLSVKEGDLVKRGQPVLFDKRNPGFNVCAPAGGKVAQINLGKRRVLESVVIETEGREEAESFKKHSVDQILGIDRHALLDVLQSTGLIALLVARPFSRMADATKHPKSIFVNGMNTAPFHPDANLVVKGHEIAFQAGLNALTRLTDKKVYLCLDAKKTNAPALKDAKNVDVHHFSGPHPAGNTSVHIHHIDPINPGDVVWTIKAQDVVLLGQFLLNGEYPTHRVITLSGPGVLKGSNRHFRIRLGARLDRLLASNIDKHEMRLIGGDILSGTKLGENPGLRFYDDAITVLPEDRERHFVGWMAPGANRLSASRTFVSKWLGFDKRKDWSLGTNQRGELRPMVLTGLYDRYVPMNVMTDFLVRAVLANDTEEAIALGLLETDPEDFALAAFVCPSKMDLCGIIRKGLELVEKEGI